MCGIIVEIISNISKTVSHKLVFFTNSFYTSFFNNKIIITNR